ncbi:MAG: hypothetical protein UHN88_00890 [Eubacterium sp.]|nr:hypothetical protein [Eubacterium sp.]
MKEKRILEKPKRRRYILTVFFLVIGIVAGLHASRFVQAQDPVAAVNRNAEVTMTAAEEKRAGDVVSEAPDGEIFRITAEYRDRQNELMLLNGNNPLRGWCWLPIVLAVTLTAVGVIAFRGEGSGRGERGFNNKI